MEENLFEPLNEGKIDVKTDSVLAKRLACTMESQPKE